MKTTHEKRKSVIEQLREIREKVSIDIKDMDHNQLEKYLSSRESIFPASAWAKGKAKKQ